jgi:hypothetical protein
MSKKQIDEKKKEAVETIARMLREDLGSLCQSQAVGNAILRGDLDDKGSHVVVGIRCRATKNMHQFLTLREEDMQDPGTLLHSAHDWAGSLRMGLCSMCPGRKKQ